MTDALIIGSSIGLCLLFGLIAIAWGVRGFRKDFMKEFRESFEKISGKIDEITEYAKVLPKISEINVRLDERTKHLDLGTLKGTVERMLKNVGKVLITADPGETKTEYHLSFDNPLFKKERLFKREAAKPVLSEIEKKMFGGEVGIALITSSRLHMLIPSTNPKDCAEYLGRFLKWLDSDYWEARKKAAEFEEII